MDLKILIAFAIFAFAASALGGSKNSRQESSLSDLCAADACSNEFTSTFPKAVAGDADAQNRVGEMLLFAEGVPQNFDAARQWFLKSSANGHAVAPNHLGRIYLNGEGVTKNDREACKWYKLSAERGDVAGRQNVAMCETGLGLAKDSEKAK